jgi:hypothetical protein
MNNHMWFNNGKHLNGTAANSADFRWTYGYEKYIVYSVVNYTAAANAEKKLRK